MYADKLQEIVQLVQPWETMSVTNRLTSQQHRVGRVGVRCESLTKKNKLRGIHDPSLASGLARLINVV